jgi:tRNA threonylcarbamoyladenosine biosynthesis protein TsaB
VKVLALDGALHAFSVAVQDDARTLAALELPATSALETGLSLVAQAIDRAGVEPAGLDRLAVGIGPGSFTGARIAISYAKSLAAGWDKALVPVDSFDALEESVVPAPGPLLAVVRGRTGVVSARYRSGGLVRRVSGYVRDALDQLGDAMEPLRHEPLSIAGDAEDVLAALAERGFKVNIISRSGAPAAQAIARIALGREPARSFHEVRADYGELPAAKVPKLP